MAFNDLREWINRLEEEGELARVKADVDWDLEIGGITQEIFDKDGPALLFENIKDYKDSWCKKLFTASLSKWSRIALMMGLPKDTPYPELIKEFQNRSKKLIKPITVDSGPVKENIIRGDNVNLWEFPSPKWHKRDGGRYIGTFGAFITKDPDTGWVNVGNYRLMVHGKDSTGITVITGQHNWMHFRKYKRMKKRMPAAFVCGWDPVLPFAATAPMAEGECEYDLMGALRDKPVEVVKCETVDLEVPATAEIVLEGEITTSFDEFVMEGPFGEYTGYYTSEPNRKPVFKVNCITFRNDPILQGTLEGVPINEDHRVCAIHHSAYYHDFLNTLIPGVKAVNVDPSTGWANMFVQIDNSYYGQVQQVASAVWATTKSVFVGKNIIVFDEDIDIFNLNKVMWGLAYRVNPPKDIIQFPGSISPTDPVIHPEERKRVAVYPGTRLLIDATKPIINKRSDQWFGEKFAPVCYTDEDTLKLIKKRWNEYGIKI